MIKVLLASNSARRRKLIKLIGWKVVSISTEVDEFLRLGESPRAYVQRVACEKVLKVPPEVSHQFAISADTIVVDRGKVYGKPNGFQEARSILQALRGHSHVVLTAIAFHNRDTKVLITDLCESIVPMRFYNDAEIDEYIHSGDAFDKAGAYAIQNRRFHPVEDFNGCYASVMGLPLCHLARSAKKLGIEAAAGLPLRCQMTLKYACRIHEAVLRGDIIG